LGGLVTSFMLLRLFVPKNGAVEGQSLDFLYWPVLPFLVNYLNRLVKGRQSTSVPVFLFLVITITQNGKDGRAHCKFNPI
jgi:hypothetical protein